MPRYYFYHPIYILILAGLLENSCNGQVNTGSTPNKVNTAKRIPEITGTPPPLGSLFGQVSDPLLVSQYIRCIFQDSNGNMWFGPAGQSVARYGPSTKFDSTQHKSLRTDVKTLHYYSKNEFFQGNKHVRQEYGNSVHAIAEDKKGNLWFGTYDGVIKYDGKTFQSYYEEHGLSNIRVGRKCILADRAGKLWVGTEGGVFQYHPSADSTGGKCFSLFQLLPAIHVKDIMEDNTGNIWFASQDHGVFRYNTALPEGHANAIKNITGKEGLGDNYAGGMIQDKSGNFWFTMKGGICRYDPRLDDETSAGKSFTEFTTKDGLGGSEVWGIYKEASGILWITARGSTTRYDPCPDISNPNAFTVFTVDDGINCCVQSMYQDRSGNMWWGAGAGLFRFDGKRFYQVKQQGPW